MSQHGASLVHDDVLAKMDALLKKHHDALARGSVTEEIPVLTEVVDETDEIIPVLTEVVDDAIEAEHGELPLPVVHALSPGDETPNQLDCQIREAIEQRLPFHIAEAVDKALPVVLEEFAMQLESLVHDAVAQALQQQLTELLRQGRSDDAPE